MNKLGFEKFEADFYADTNTAFIKPIRIFVSQPMKGLANEQIEAERARIISVLTELYENDIEVIESFFKDAPVDAEPLWFLGESIKLLSTADVAFFARGWDKARGCRIEHLCAEEYGIPCIVEVE